MRLATVFTVSIAQRGEQTQAADRKCFVSTATLVTAHKTLVRAAPRHPANGSRPRKNSAPVSRYH
ncbi:hypothetical protein CG435_23530 [Pantoea ananatis]|nr:hypothetical protein CG435_23530 [Pantoea ananatis]